MRLRRTVVAILTAALLGLHGEASAATCDIAPGLNSKQLQDALAKCSNGTALSPTVIRFPVGASYFQEAPIHLVRRQHLIIDARGSTFKTTTKSSTSNWAQFMLFKARDVTLRNFKIEGNFYPDPAVYPKRQIMSYYCEAQAGIAFYGGVRIAVVDSVARHTCGDGFGAYRSHIYSQNFVPHEANEVPTNLRMQRLKVYSPARMCWGPTAVDGGLIADNYCEDAWYGVMDVEKDVPEDPVRNLAVVRNRARGFNMYGFLVPVGGQNGVNRNIRILDNVFETPPDQTCSPSIWVGVLAYGSADRFQGVIAERNTIHTMDEAVSFVHVDGGRIRNNTVHKVPLPPGYTVGGWCPAPHGTFTVQDSTNVAVVGNRVLG